MLATCRLQYSSTFRDKVSFRNHDKLNIMDCNCILMPCPWNNRSKFWHHFGKKNSYHKTHPNKITKTCWLELHRGSLFHSYVSSKVPSNGGGCCTSNPNRSRSCTCGELWFAITAPKSDHFRMVITFDALYILPQPHREKEGLSSIIIIIMINFVLQNLNFQVNNRRGFH